MTSIETISREPITASTAQEAVFDAPSSACRKDTLPPCRATLFCSSAMRGLFREIESNTDTGYSELERIGIVVAELPANGSEYAGTGNFLHVVLIDAELLHEQNTALQQFLPWLRGGTTPFISIIVGHDATSGVLAGLLRSDEIFVTLPAEASPSHIIQAVQRAMEYYALSLRSSAMEREVQTYTSQMQELNRIGIALSAERDLDTLLEMILTKSRTITNSDASSLYLVEPDPAGGSRLRFKLSQNESLTFSVDKPMPISSDSLAGYVALTGESLLFDDVYILPDDVPYSFNRSYDEAHGYRTKSMLVVPMKTHNGEILGVLQLINRKASFGVILIDEETVHRTVVPFTAMEQELSGSIASQAAVAIENSALYQSIENLFEGFVTASARAIEQRDPTTSGHSERVAILTLGVADVVTRIERGRFGDIKFSAAQIKELRYAALLHDFGKVGVREDVLLKRNKLHEHELDLLRMRFEFVRNLREKELSERKVETLLAEDRETALSQFEAWDAEMADDLREIDEFLQIILRANDPLLQWMDDEAYERQRSALGRMAHVYYSDRGHRTRPLLGDHELRALSVRRGSLGEEERREIERHVTHTFDFLKQIPWTRDYNQVPNIAHCHHERCNGTGYPRGLTKGEIPLQARIMTVVDIYDALTASDRPYKKACTPDRAIDIMYDEARDGHIERELLDVFVTYRVWKLTSGWKKRAA